MEALTPQQQLVAEVYHKLRPYQQEVMKNQVRQKARLNYMKMGMGKTLTTMTSIIYAEAFPCIIICTKAAMYVWEEELRKWFNEAAVIYTGTPKKRDTLFKQFIAEGTHFIVTTYALAEELGIKFGIIDAAKAKRVNSRGTQAKASTPPGTKPVKRHVGGLIADEIQLGGLFNHKSKTYGVFKQLAKHIPYRYLLTGTPMRKGVIDLYAPLSLVDPVKFDSYWKYVAKYCVTIDTGFGKSIERNPADVIAFRAMLREYADILDKKDHIKDLPEKTRQGIRIDMNPEQRRVYDEITEQLFAETDSGELIMAPSRLALMVRQRQLLVCPQELGLTGRGEAIDTLLEMAGELVDAKSPFVIFTPFRRAVRWINEALRQEFGTIKIFEIVGGLTPEQFRDAWQGFQNYKGSAPSALICVVRSGASFHATVADTAFFIGFEWDCNQNLQAEDRLHRIGQKSAVTCYYIGYRNTVDDEILLKLNDKQFASDLVLSNEQVFQAVLKRRNGGA